MAGSGQLEVGGSCHGMKNMPMSILLPAWKVGMLNCGGPTADDPICVPDSGKFPAKDVPDFGTLANSGRCPVCLAGT